MTLEINQALCTGNRLSKSSAQTSTKLKLKVKPCKTTAVHELQARDPLTVGFCAHVGYMYPLPEPDRLEIKPSHN
jgi:hypothetical protein